MPASTTQGARTAPASGLRQITLNVTPEMYERVEDFRFRRRYANRNDALRVLLRAGLAAYGQLGLPYQRDTSEENHAKEG